MKARALLFRSSPFLSFSLEGDLGAATMLPVPREKSRTATEAESTAALQPKGEVEELDLGPKDSLYQMSMRGCMYWMSPEILAGRKYGRRTDIW